MKRSGRPPTLASDNGFILLEVLLAVVLVGILVVPLANALVGSLKQAHDLRLRTGEDLGAGSATGSAAWEWGVKVVDAWWRPGPVLHVKVWGGTAPSATQGEVGLWVDGWSMGAQPFAMDGSGSGQSPSVEEVQVGPQLWTDLADSELVVRVRLAEGPWGPPWRLAVPGPSGDSPAPGSASAVNGEPTLVVHRSAAGTASLRVSWSPGALSAPPFSLLFVLQTTLDGWSGVTLDGRSQWCRMEKGRSADVYY